MYIYIFTYIKTLKNMHENITAVSLDSKIIYNYVFIFYLCFPIYL